MLYSGNGSSGHAITGVGFQPDWVWLKGRNYNGASHSLTDSVRGATKRLVSDSTSAEATNAQYLQSFDSDGFTVGSHAAHNSGSHTFVAWNWLAGGSAVTNNDGDLTSSVSANTKSGFSIVAWTTGTGTVGHGLDKAPEIIFEKKRGASGDWIVDYTVVDGTLDYVRLNTTAAGTNGAIALPTTTVFTPNTGASTAVAYCFHSVDGYSKVGSYSANNSSDGPFVYLGFRPAFILIKATNRTSHWIMQDNKRPGYNQTSIALFSNLNNAESTDRHVDFLSNGFKLRLTALDPNTNTAEYIYLAFAEQPFKYSNAR